MHGPKINMSKLTKLHWSENDLNNAKLAVEFVQRIMNDHDFNGIRELYRGQQYTQHNRNIADGIEGVIEAVSRLVNNAPEFSYDIKHILVDGDHVVLHSHVTLKAKHRGIETEGFNIMDTWRVENGRLVEHWDAVQGISFSMRLYALLTGGKIRNKNSIF